MVPYLGQTLPLYGSMLFHVQYKGFWSYPSAIYLAVDLIGAKFVNTMTKHIMADYTYEQLDSIGVDSMEDAITLEMKPRGREKQKLFNFETLQKEDIANLIASYSPAHSKWQRVGEPKVKQVSKYYSTYLCKLSSSTLIRFTCQRRRR